MDIYNTRSSSTNSYSLNLLYFRGTRQPSSRSRDVDDRRDKNRAPPRQSQHKEYRDNSTPPRDNGQKSRGRFSDRRLHSRESDRYYDGARDLPRDKSARDVSPGARDNSVPEHQLRPASPEDSRRNASRAMRYINDPNNDTDDDINRYFSFNVEALTITRKFSLCKPKLY